MLYNYCKPCFELTMTGYAPMRYWHLRRISVSKQWIELTYSILHSMYSKPHLVASDEDSQVGAERTNFEGKSCEKKNNKWTSIVIINTEKDDEPRFSVDWKEKTLQLHETMFRSARWTEVLFRRKVEDVVASERHYRIVPIKNIRVLHSRGHFWDAQRPMSLSYSSYVYN